METIAERLQYARKQKGLSFKNLGEMVGVSGDAIRKAIDRNSIKAYHLNIISEKLGLSKEWLEHGTGDMHGRKPNDINSVIDYFKSQPQPNDLKVKDPLEMDYSDKDVNQHLKVGVDQYVMIMPLLGYSAQASFPDHFQDAEFIGDLEKHSIVVNQKAPPQGRYFAFRVKGNSMDNGVAGEAIQQGNIVTGRELQQHHWKNKLHLNKFKNWVIYTTKSSMPLVKEIISHDVESGIIRCRSLNTAPEYQDFDLSLNDVTGLFNIVNVSWKPIDG